MNSKWSGYATKRQHGVGITIKVENGIEGIEIQEVIQVSPRIITANILLVVVPYELYAVTRPPKSIPFHQKISFTASS